MSMKIVSVLLSCVVVIGAAAQPVRAENSRDSQLSNRLAKASSLSLSEGKVQAGTLVGGQFGVGGWWFLCPHLGPVSENSIPFRALGENFDSRSSGEMCFSPWPSDLA